MTTRRRSVLIALAFVVDVRAARAQCPATVTPSNVSVSSIGSTSSLSVVTGTSCSWTATSSVSWITIISATGSGIGQVNYAVAPNPTAGSRTGNLTVAGQTVTFTQAANSCVYSVTPTSVTVPPIGSSSALSIVTGSSCSWTAASTVSWITITSGASGTGILPVNYTVATNATTAARTGTVIVGGQTVTFTQAQQGHRAPTPPANLVIR